MKILIDLTSLADNFSGIERFAMSIAKELIKNQSIQYILLFKNEIHKEFVQEYSNVQKIVLNGKNKLMFNQVILPLKLLKIRADYYLFLAFPAPFFFFKHNSISAIHDVGCWDCPSTNKKYMSLYFKIMYRKASLKNKPIITVSEFSKKRIMDILKVKEDNIKVVYNGLSENIMNFQKDELRNKEVKKKYFLPEKYILCLSTLEPRKNLKLLVAAYSDLIQNQKIDFDLVLAGRKGWMVDDLLSGYQKCVTNRIHFTGFVDDEDLPYVYYNAAFFVFPSSYEGFGIPPIESLAVGTMVVSSDAASLPEVLKNQVIYFGNNNIEELKNAICKVAYMDKAEKIIHSENGVHFAKTYTWSAAGTKVEEILK